MAAPTKVPIAALRRLSREDEPVSAPAVAPIKAPATAPVDAFGLDSQPARVIESKMTSEMLKIRPTNSSHPMASDFYSRLQSHV
jgi:hypothetical protein